MSDNCHFELYKKEDNLDKPIFINNREEIKNLKIGQAFYFDYSPNKLYKLKEYNDYHDCKYCEFKDSIRCSYIACNANERKDGKNVIVITYNPAKPEKLTNKEMKEPSKDSNKEYKSGKFECLTTMEDVKGWYYAAIFCASNIFKYSWRLGKKDPALKENAKITDYSNRYKDILKRNMKYNYNGKTVAVIDRIDGFVLFFDGKDKHIVTEENFNNLSNY